MPVKKREMLDRFLSFVKENELFGPDQKVLVAVSGGIDSMVLFHLFEASGFQFGVVHCNFQLRGEDSDADEQFLKDKVKKHGIPAFFKRFDTEEYARINGVSIEMAAREIRYAYFLDLSLEYQYDVIATAHHLDDQVETFFLNLMRKSGIKGLTGIKEKNGKIIRPLLFSTRDEIENFARSQNIVYREDRSNSEVIFQRNFIRHKILPLFAEINPAFQKNVLAGMDNLRQAERVYNYYIQQEIEKVVREDGNEVAIDIDLLLKYRFPKVLLYEILTVYHFNSTVISEIFSTMSNDSGRQFFSKSHRVVKDRKKLFVLPLKEEDHRIYYIEKDTIGNTISSLHSPLPLKVNVIGKDEFMPGDNPAVACFDLDELEFPLLMRHWKQGDYFQPFGMSGFKKVSDFFIDQKVPLHEKESAWLLCSGEKIVWIMGYRMDNRFRVKAKTKKVLKIVLQ